MNAYTRREADEIRCDCGLHAPIYDPDNERRERPHLLFTNAEYQAAQRFLAHQYEDDPTLDAPEVTDADEPMFGTDDAA